ncbi:MAG: acyl-CoA carboxylase epsilon subunit [Actinomycetota bacterium]
MTGEQETVPPAPLLRIVTPSTTPEELAALVVVLAARAAAAGPAPRRPRRWSDPGRGLRTGVRPGPGAWSAAR